MAKLVLLRDFLHRIKRPIDLIADEKYKLITIKLKHNGVVLREEKIGAEIKSKMYQVKSGDFILSGIDARNGAFGIVPSELDGAIVTNDFWYFEIDEAIVDKHFFLELTSTKWFDEICRKGSDGTTQRIRLQKNKFFNQEIAIPSLKTQRKFVNIFQQTKKRNSKLCAELTHQQSLLKKLRQQILQEAIEGKLSADWRQQNPKTEPASELLKHIQAEKAQLIKNKKIKAQKPLAPINQEEKPFALPDGWEWCQLGDVINLYEAGKSVKCMDRQIEDEEWGVIKTSAITSSTFQESEHKFYQPDTPSDISKAIRNGDLLFCRASGSKGLAGKCSLVSNISKNLLLSDKTLRLTTSENINKRYIYFHNETRHTTAYYSKLNTGKSTSMNNITREQLLSKPIPLPPLAEQKVIVAKAEKLLTLCDQLESKINQSQHHANSLMQAVLQEAFAGASI